MAEAYGLWPGVVAIAADANLYCVPCAKRLYGDEAIQAVVDAVPSWGKYRDHEGNPFGVVLRWSEDAHTQYCGAPGCGERLCEEYCGCYQHPELWQQHGVVWVES